MVTRGVPIFKNNHFISYPNNKIITKTARKKQTNNRDE